MIKRIEKFNIILLIVGIIILACLIIYEGLNNLITDNYTSLGDPYYTNQILAFERAPRIIWMTLINLALVVIEFIIMIIKKLCSKS